MENELKIEQKQILKTYKKISQDIIPSYIGKHIVFEIGEEGSHVCSGYLNKYDKRFVQITDFKEHHVSLSEIFNYNLTDKSFNDITDKRSVRYALPIRNIAVCLIASVQTLEDIINTKRANQNDN